MTDRRTTSDGWLLHAISVAAGEGRATLDSIVAAGDFINHATFNADELSDGLGRLLSAGLVTRDDAGFAPASEASMRLSRGGLTRQRDTAERLADKANVQSLAPSAEAPTEAECSAAIRKYLGRAASASRRAV